MTGCKNEPSHEPEPGSQVSTEVVVPHGGTDGVRAVSKPLRPRSANTTPASTAARAPVSARSIQSPGPASCPCHKPPASSNSSSCASQQASNEQAPATSKQPSPSAGQGSGATVLRPGRALVTVHVMCLSASPCRVLKLWWPRSSWSQLEPAEAGRDPAGGPGRSGTLELGCSPRVKRPSAQRTACPVGVPRNEACSGPAQPSGSAYWRPPRHRWAVSSSGADSAAAAAAHTVPGLVLKSFVSGLPAQPVHVNGGQQGDTARVARNSTIAAAAGDRVERGAVVMLVSWAHAGTGHNTLGAGRLLCVRSPEPE